MMKKFRDIKKLPTWVFYPLIWILGLMRLTMRKKVIGTYDPNKTVLLNIWHNRLIFCTAPFSKEYIKKTVAIISPSRDGQYIADVLKILGLDAVRGSSSKNPARAMFAAIKALKSGKNVTLTPDGPRGPKYKIKKGVIQIAGKAGVEIQPFAINASKYWELKSWDGFQIPKPFCTLTYVFAETIKVPENLSDQEIEDYVLKVENALHTISIDE